MGLTLLSSQFEEKLTSGEYRVDSDGEIYEFMFRSVPGSRNLVIYFHPAFNIKMLKSMPRFWSIPTDENMLSICDNFFRKIKLEPTELFYKTESITVAGWFMFLQEVLPDMIRRIIDKNGFERVILVGGSSGGFAALYYSFFIPDSVAIAVNPQTDLKYNLKSKEALGVGFGDISLKCTNLTPLYNKGFLNKIVYIVNNMSLADMRGHTLPFISGLYNENTILKTDFWGVNGHSDSIPPEEYSLWIKAVCTAKSTAVTDISDAYYRLKKGGGDAK